MAFAESRRAEAAATDGNQMADRVTSFVRSLTDGGVSDRTQTPLAVKVVLALVG